MVTSKRALQRWSGIAAALALVAALLAWAGRDAWPQGVADVPVVAWATLLSGLVLSHALRALRLYTEWRAQVGASLLTCLAISLQHNAAVNLVPLRGGELAYPWLLHRHLRVSVRDATTSLLALRIQDAVVLAALAIVWWAPWVAGLRWTLAVALLAVGVALGGRASGWACTLASWWAKLAALGGSLALLDTMLFSQGLAAALGGELAALVPLQGPAGLGTYEVGVLAGARLAGAGSRSLVGAALLLHAISWVVALLAAGVTLLWHRPLTSPPLYPPVPPEPTP